MRPYLHGRRRLRGRRRTMVSLATAVSAAVLLSACNGAMSSSDRKDAAAGYDKKADVTLTWWTGQTPEAQKTAEQLAQQYHQAHPNVTIKTSQGADTADELLPKITAGYQDGSYPDVSYAYGSWAGQLAAGGHTQDLTDYVQKPDFGWEDFPGAAQRTATSNGIVMGIPALVDNLALIYNKKIFDDAGVGYPTDNWTWDQFRTAAKKLTDQEKGVWGTAYSVAGGEDTTWHLWPLLWQRGGAILSGKRPAFNSAEGVAALETLRAIAVDDKSMWLDPTDEKYGAMFRDGKIGMMMSGPWELLELAQTNVKYGVVQLPGFKGDHQTVSGPDLWVLFDHDDADRAGASRDFVKWLTSKDIDAKWNLAIGNLPVRDIEQFTPQFFAYTQEYPGGREFFENLENARQSRPTVTGYDDMSRNVGEAIASVLQGKSKPKEALDLAAAKSVGPLSGS
ncbi:ABC transporter substrate-binding protein [Cryptosporangium sp. NPDC048952]|uniref:ABC transporter substrate-binding protein n=1 Tax=Cryptosporangium sp. NPDC048952 TaxID=3363961 RepID=UPI00371D6C62